MDILQNIDVGLVVLDKITAYSCGMLLWKTTAASAHKVPRQKIHGFIPRYRAKWLEQKFEPVFS